MAAPEEINADMLAFWNGKGGDIWVARQEHTDITLAPATSALLVFAAPRAGERVVDIGCGCGAPTLEFARAVGPSGRVAGLDISGPSRAAPAAAAEVGAERSRNVRLRRSRPRDRGCYRGRLGAAALRETRHGPRYRRRPRAGGGCGSVHPDRRREQLAAQPAIRGRFGRRRLCSRGPRALCGRCESAIAGRDVVDQQRACLNGRRH
jgi:SAM-dependent methyltransferase